jgi:hypothetical protein
MNWVLIFFSKETSVIRDDKKLKQGHARAKHANNLMLYRKYAGFV